MNTTINEQHLEQDCVCVCASVGRWRRSVTIREKGTERQYALRAKALDMGWSEPSVQILDGDLGKSGAHDNGSGGFRRLLV